MATLHPLLDDANKSQLRSFMPTTKQRAYHTTVGASSADTPAAARLLQDGDEFVRGVATNERLWRLENPLASSRARWASSGLRIASVRS